MPERKAVYHNRQSPANHHKNCFGKGQDSHIQRISECISNGVVKSCKNWEHMHKRHYNNHSHCKKRHPEPCGKCNVRITHNKYIPCQYANHQKNDQPDDCCLFKILFEGFKKSSDNVSFLVSHHLKTYIIQSRHGRSHRNNRNAAD